MQSQHFEQVTVFLPCVCFSVSEQEAEHRQLSFLMLCAVRSYGYPGWWESWVSDWKKKIKNQCFTLFLMPEKVRGLHRWAESTVQGGRVSRVRVFAFSLPSAESWQWQEDSWTRSSSWPWDSGPECTKSKIWGSAAPGNKQKISCPQNKGK